jgi:hypothetical protein
MLFQTFSLQNIMSLFIYFLAALVLASVLVLFSAVFTYIVIIWYRNRDREKQSLDSTLLQVALPRENEIKIDAAEQLFSSFASMRKGGRLSFLKLQPHLSFELVGMPGDIRFYVNTPNKFKDLVEKQINGAYPDAEIKVVEEKQQKKDFVLGNEYNIFSDSAKVAFASLRLKTSDYLPLKVFKDLPTDPLSSITSVLAKMTEGEGAAVQILVSPADSKWKKLGRKYIARTKKNESNPETAKYAADPKELEGIENKIGKPGFNTVVRIVVSSSTIEAAEAHLGNIVSAFSQFDGANSFKKNKHRFKGMFMVDFIYRYMPLRGQNSVLTSEELATVFHFPNKSVATPHIFWISSKRAPAPAQIPDSGLYLGMSTYRGLSRPVYMGEDDRRRHMYIIGKTGVGKSELLKQMILQDIKEGKGIGVVDPHGDLIEDILKLIPPERSEDVILFDP